MSGDQIGTGNARPSVGGSSSNSALDDSQPFTDPPSSPSSCKRTCSPPTFYSSTYASGPHRIKQHEADPFPAIKTSRKQKFLCNSTGQHRLCCVLCEPTAIHRRFMLISTLSDALITRMLLCFASLAVSSGTNCACAILILLETLADHLYSSVASLFLR